MSITQTESVSVALGIQNAMRMRHIVNCGLSCSTIFFHITSKRHVEKKLLNTKCVFRLRVQLSSKTVSFLRSNEHDMIKNFY